MTCGKVGASILLTFVMGCSGVQDAVRTQDDPACKTVVEGYLHSRALFDGKVPALVLHWSAQTKKILTGEIISRSDSGIVFDPAREGPLHDPDAKHYPYTAIQCAIDREGNIIYGTLPEKYGNTWNMEIDLSHEGGESEKPTRLTLNPNERFSFCLKPGVYTVKEIGLTSNLKYEDRSVMLPSMTIRVHEGVANYIGDLFLDFATKVDSSVCLIVTEATYRPGYYVMSNFGLLGGIVDLLSREGTQGHALQVNVDTAFQSDAKRAIVVSPLTIVQPRPDGLTK